jgi:NAD(P)-dependent dehydrogenase (short-subunit alcohol dehydrogenase family)
VTSLAGRVTLVTGASRGIGAAIARALMLEGAHVIRIARSLPERSAEGFQDIPADLTETQQVSSLAARVLAQHGPPDLVVSNAGTFVLKSLETTDLADLDSQLALNAKAPFALAKAFLPAMRDAGTGTFITIGSVADHMGYPENAAYAASKYAARGLHETLVSEYRGTGVRLTLISPGPTDTAMWDPVDPDRRAGFVARARMLRPEDVADAVVFVASRPPHVHVDWLRLGPVG